MNKLDFFFYFVVKYQRKLDDDVWYMRNSFGKNEIGKFFFIVAKNVGLQGRVINYLVRKICILRFFDVDVLDNFVVQLSGYRSLKSFDVYKSVSYEY